MQNIQYAEYVENIFDKINNLFFYLSKIYVTIIVIANGIFNRKDYDINGN